MDERQTLIVTIAELEARLADLQKRLPAHSIPPAMIAEMDELDEQLAEARLRLVELNSPPQY
ncbi:MAG: histidine kinase [Chloroflexi bacterium]|nr:histidine kinase [Chloroflexota bacterium]